MTLRRATLWTLPLLVACASPAPTSSQSEAIDSDAPFLAIAKKSTPSNVVTSDLHLRSLPAAGNESIYLVINRKELGQKWFLSAFLEKFSPGGIVGGAGASLGTRVVSFATQNDKLYVFDAGDSKAPSGVDDQELVMDAYPIVTDPTLLKVYPASKWVIFDPGQSQNPYGFAGDMFAKTKGARFETQLSYQQGFKAISDGIEVQQVFSGYADRAVGDGFPEPNVFHANGTIALSLRRYSTGAKFKPAPYADDSFYFANEATALTGTPATNKWNIAPGMKPIKWVISRDILVTQAAAGGVFDLVAAVRAGIEGWNEAFGFKVLEASLASPGDHVGDDTLNFFTWDTDPSIGYAFADHRANPNTGEIRGASVYFSSAFFQADYFGTETVPANAGLAARFATRPHLPSMTWAGMHANPTCSRFVGDAFASALHAAVIAGPVNGDVKLKATQFLTHVVMHEIGHTLGLRHNFKGSLVADGALPTSVMDYLDNDASVTMVHPGKYDVAAVQYLYGFSTAQPTQAFCPDEGVALDPDCNTFDRSDDPLRKFYGKGYRLYADYEISHGGSASFARGATAFYANGVAQYARAGSGAAPTDAMDLLFTHISAPGEPPASAGQAAVIDDLHTFVMRRLYLDPSADRGDITRAPLDVVLPQTLAQLRGVLMNADGIRSYGSRRSAVDVLKQLQSDDALQVLTDGRAAVTATLATLSPTDALRAADLIARIDAATHPYFVH